MKEKLLITVVALFLSFITAYGQSHVSEIRWIDSESTTYTGLLVLYPNNSGVFKVKFYHPSVGWIWIYQKAKLTNQFDNYGNCTSFINCSYPQASPNVPYSADNFIVYPNGAMYTQDYSGKWSTQIVSVVIAQQYWQRKFQEYGLK